MIHCFHRKYQQEYQCHSVTAIERHLDAKQTDIFFQSILFASSAVIMHASTKLEFEARPGRSGGKCTNRMPFQGRPPSSNRTCSRLCDSILSLNYTECVQKMATPTNGSLFDSLRVTYLHLIKEHCLIAKKFKIALEGASDSGDGFRIGTSNHGSGQQLARSSMDSSHPFSPAGVVPDHETSVYTAIPPHRHAVRCDPHNSVRPGRLDQVAKRKAMGRNVLQTTNQLDFRAIAMIRCLFLIQMEDLTIQVAKARRFL